MRVKFLSVGALTSIVVIFAMAASYMPAKAGSDNNSDPYAGDYTFGSLPTGTFIAAQYQGYFRSDAFIDTKGSSLPNSHANIYEEFTRFAYISQLWGHPLAIDAEIPFATLTEVNIPGTNNQVARGFVDPVVNITYWLDADLKNQRWLGFTSHFYLPYGRHFDNQKAINVSTPDQLTYVPQIGYTEGLQKFSSRLSGLYFDFVANASLHTNGQNPLYIINPASAPVPGILSYSTLTQATSYDVRAYLRYQPNAAALLFVAIGVEKSWGGEQSATNGTFAVSGLPIVIPQPSLSLSKDEFLKGHFQLEIPAAQDFAIAADVVHDFSRVGGFREDFGAEIRLLKYFAPPPPSR
jgi:hypothetical protein